MLFHLLFHVIYIQFRGGLLLGRAWGSLRGLSSLHALLFDKQEEPTTTGIIPANPHQEPSHETTSHPLPSPTSSSPPSSSPPSPPPAPPTPPCRTIATVVTANAASSTPESDLVDWALLLLRDPDHPAGQITPSPEVSTEGYHGGEERRGRRRSRRRMTYAFAGLPARAVEIWLLPPVENNNHNNHYNNNNTGNNNTGGDDHDHHDHQDHRPTDRRHPNSSHPATTTPCPCHASYFPDVTTSLIQEAYAHVYRR